MRLNGEFRTFCWLLLTAGAVPLHAQFSAQACPSGPAGPLINAITAGTTLQSFPLCLFGAFAPAATYNVLLTSPLQTLSLPNVAPQSNSLIEINVPSAFYASVANAAAGDTVNITLSGGGNQTGTFFINPPMVAGGPIFISAVNSPVHYVLFTGGTSPTQGGITGNGPPGMVNFLASGNSWSGTPTAAGIFQFSFNDSDIWDNFVNLAMAAYVVPVPQITSVSPPAITAGSDNTPMLINGSGFVSPAFILQVNIPGTTVSITPPGGSAVTITPGNFTGNALSITVPSNLLATTGIYQVQVRNPSQVNSNAFTFAVTPSVTSLSTFTRTAGAPPFQLGVTGTGFVKGSVVQVNGSAVPTAFVNATSLTATFPTVNTLGFQNITVLNPDSTVSPLSSGAAVDVVAGPLITSLNPNTIVAGSPSFTLTIKGSNFVNGETVLFNSQPLAPTLVNNQLTVTVPAAVVANPGTVPVAVTTADGYTSAPLLFIIQSSTPAIPPLQLITLPPLASGVVNTAYNITFAATGGTTPYSFSVTNGSLPPGLKLSPSGVVSGTPTTIGSSRFTLQVTDSTGTTYALDYTISIAPTPLLLTTPPLANVLVNTPLSVQFTGSGGYPPYSFVEFGSLPPGVTFNSSGLLSGTPTRTGTYPFLVYLDDSQGGATSGQFSLMVAIPGLLITPASPLPPGQVAVPYTTQLAATGGQGPPYFWSATGLPQGLTIANNSGLIAGIPRAAGTFTIPVTISDTLGKTVTQNYTLVIAGVALNLGAPSLTSGSVASGFSTAFSATGGTGIYTFSGTGLPPGLTLLSTGVLSGTPTTAGTYTANVSVTDTQQQTASGTFKFTITPAISVTGATISNAVSGVAITPTQLTASGGTPPYQWQSASLPPGLTLSANGTLSGTPSAPGTYSFLVYAVDSNGALASGTVNVTVGLPAAPTVTITGLPATNAPATQPAAQVTLGNAYPVAVTATLTLTFTPDSGPDDPSVQFASGGRTAQVTIPANSTIGLSSIGLQTGTLAGTVKITAQLTAGSQNITPTPAPSISVRVNAAIPVITSLTATRTSTGFTVVVVGYSSSRDVSTANYQFSATNGATLQTSQASIPVSSLFSTWYQSSSAAPYGSQFTLTQPFTVSGSNTAVLSVTLTLTNSVGTSATMTAILH